MLLDTSDTVVLCLRWSGSSYIYILRIYIILKVRLHIEHLLDSITVRAFGPNNSYSTSMKMLLTDGTLRRITTSRGNKVLCLLLARFWYDPVCGLVPDSLEGRSLVRRMLPGNKPGNGVLLQPPLPHLALSGVRWRLHGYSLTEIPQA